jgi:hypothetical protein
MIWSQNLSLFQGCGEIKEYFNILFVQLMVFQAHAETLDTTLQRQECQLATKLAKGNSNYLLFNSDAVEILCTWTKALMLLEIFHEVIVHFLPDMVCMSH